MIALYLAVLLIGILSLSTQIVLIRELLILFYGNEMSVGIILASWLLWSSLGSLLLGRFSDRIKAPLRALIIAEIIMVLFFIAALVSIRILSPFLHAVSGQIVSLKSILLYSFLIPVPVCLINGFLFSLGCQTLKKNQPEEISPVGKIYLLEALGAACGGFFTSFIFIRFFNPFGIALTLIFLICITLLLLKKSFPVASRGKYISVLLLFLMVIILASAVIYSPKLELLTRKYSWKKTTLIKSSDSLFGHISVTKTSSQYNFYENGLFLYAVPDVFTSEFSIQPALLSSPHPETILFIGGSPEGIITESFKHPSIKEVVFVEIDPQLIKTSLQFVSDTSKKYIQDNRIVFHHIDGRRYVKNTDRLFDCVIINIPNPHTAQINRLYTKEFFSEVSRIMTDDGILSFSVTSSANYIGEELKDLLSCLVKTLDEVFPDSVIIPGDTMYFLACKKKGILTEDYTILEETRKKRRINLDYFRSYYLKDIMSGWRLERVKQRIQPDGTTPVNTDFNPVGYFLNLVFWSTYFTDSITVLLKAFSQINFNWFLFLPLLSIVSIFLVRIFKCKTNKLSIIVPIFTSGFSEMTYQVVILISFQMLYGYVYYKLGIIFTAFMVGTALGSYTVTKTITSLKKTFRQFIVVQGAFVLFSLILPLIIFVCARFSENILFGFAGENIILPGIPLLAGFLNGYQFPLGNRLFRQEVSSMGKSAGLLYGTDLLGAFTGALFISLIVLPVLGIIKTCLISALLNFASLTLLPGYRHCE